MASAGPAQSPWNPHLSWHGWVILGWSAGAVLFFAYMLLACFSLWLVGRRSSPVTDPDWLALLDESRQTLKFHRKVELLTCPGRTMPMTWGVLRTHILLPGDTAHWTADQKRAVLLHELAHARRFDCQSQLIAHLACALHWFNPLVWFAWRRMQAEREQACDDLVLAAGTRASAYAEQLLQIAADMPPIRFSVAAIAMARPSKLEGRLLAILDVKRNRRALSWTAAISALLLMTVLATPLAMLRADNTPDTLRAQDSKAKTSPTEQSNAAPKLAQGLGRVVDTAGKPIEGAVLKSEVSKWTATTARDGSFLLPVSDPGSPERLTITAPGFSRRESVDAAQIPGGGIVWPDAGVITLYRSARLEGVVLGTDGKPLAGAPISANVYFLKGGFMANAIRAISDEHGRFVIDDVPPGEMALEYPWLGPTNEDLSAGRWKKWIKPGQSFPAFPEAGGTGMVLKIGQGQVRSDLVLDLSKSIATAQGRVVDRNGEPVANASVYLCCKLSTGSTGICSQGIPDVMTDKQGSYTLQRLPMGNWYLEAYLGNTLAEPVPVVLSNAKVFAADLVLPVKRGSNGRIRRVAPMDPSQTVREWIDATLAGDAEGAKEVVVPSSPIALVSDRLTALLRQINSFPSFSENSLGQSEATSNAVTFADGHRDVLKFKLVGKTGQWKLNEAVDGTGASVLLDAAPAAAPATPNQESRDDAPAAKPATAAFVRTVSYRKYAADDAKGVEKLMAADDGRQRVEEPDGSFIVRDATRAKQLYVNPAKKTAVLSRMENLLVDDPMFSVADIERLADPGQHVFVSLGTTPNPNGVVEEFQFSAAGLKRLVWRDAATHRPSKIQIDLPAEPPVRAVTTLVLDSIVFDAPLDESAFSLQPPAGYLVTNGVVRFKTIVLNEPATQPAGTQRTGAPAPSGEVFVMGKVQRPGAYLLSSKQLTLRQLVTAAGLDSKDSVVVLHRHEGRDDKEFNLEEIVSGKVTDPPLEAGDVAIVADESVRVMTDRAHRDSPEINR
jgi:beta-lactamase regulating signal transducer with metallopeptidase domain